MAIEPNRVKALFQAAIERHDPAERGAFLDREIGDDAALRDRLDALLSAYDQPPEALERPLGEDVAITVDADPDATRDVPSKSPAPTDFNAPTRDHPAENDPDRPDWLIAGRYKLRQEIGEGGMGTVFLAEQTQPIRRQVALKLIKAGMDSRNVLARFESERQALALMDHPNIAKVLDAGTTEQGRPFFVMELVKGIPLTDYCDQHRLDLPTRLNLFRQICSAVQHAHQKGIIHRDLKPTNILVESHDGKPVPKVIDFGLAKAVSGMQLSEHSLYTAFGSVTGTPLYMAPEQATFNALDVDTRADIYALGVILYELLTGSTPIQRETLKRAALDEMLRVIREVEPPTPSSRISSSESLPSLAASRLIEPARLSRLVRGDLDWIVMKALAKERDRRYDSAIGLANDVERFLNHEPVIAGPPGTRYRVRKFVQRNRAKVAAAALVVVALVVGIAGTTLGLVEARTQRGLARIETKKAKDALVQEAVQRRQAETLLSQVEKSNDILGSIFKDINERDPKNTGLPLGVRLAARLDQAESQIQGDRIGNPRIAIRLKKTLAESQIGLGEMKKGLALLGKVRDETSAEYGADSPEALRAAADFAEATILYGDDKIGRPLLEKAVQEMEAKLGEGNRDTLRFMSKLALAYSNEGRRDLASPLFKRAAILMEANLGPGDPETLETMMLHAMHSPSDQVVPLLRRALQLAEANLGLGHQTTLGIMNWLAGHVISRDRDEGQRLFERVYQSSREKRGPDDYFTLLMMGRLAAAYRHLGRTDKALPLYEEQSRLYRAKFGVEQADDYYSWRTLADAYKDAGQSVKALALGEEMLALQKAKYGPDDPKTREQMRRLATEYLTAGDVDRAKALAAQVAGYREGEDAQGSIRHARALACLGEAYRSNGKWSEASSLLQQALEVLRVKQPAAAETFEVESQLGGALVYQGKTAEAEPLLWAAYDGQRKQGGTFDGHAMSPYRKTVERLFALGDSTGKPPGPPERVLPLYEEVFRLTRLNFGLNRPEAPDTLSALRRLAGAYVAFDKPEKARALIREHAGVREGKDGPDSLAAARAASWLGDAYVAKSKWPEAEAAMREALTVFKAKEPDAWTTFDAESQLGWALLYQGKPAETLLRSGYEGLKRTAATIPGDEKSRVTRALDRLIWAAEWAHKPDEMKRWKDEKAKGIAESPDGKKP